MTTSNLFDQTTPTEETTPIEGSYVEALVGEGKKFKDIEALARGKHEADQHVLQVQREAAAARDKIKELEIKLQERITLEEFMKELKTPDNDGDVTNLPPSTPIVNAPSPDDIGAIIDARLQEQRKKEQVQANLESVKEELRAAWGQDWLPKLVSRARELGVAESFLDGVAAQSPKAFLALVLDKSTPPSPNADVPPRTQMAPRTHNDAYNTVRNQSYYDKMRKTDPALYRSERMTQQRHRDAQRLGEQFFQ